MKFKEVVMQRYMLAESSTVELPDSGVVLFVGPNGSGKSAVIEAISMCLWGESLRDCSPWHPGRSGAVQVCSDIGVVRRSANSKHVKTVDWSGSEDKSLTASKAQALLDKVLPPFSTWRKTNTYSADMLDSFSNATDKQRKQLLEDIIRMDKFDIGLEKAKKALSNAKMSHSQYQQSLHSVKLEVARLRSMLSELRTLRNNAGTEQDLLDLRSKAKSVNEQLTHARQEAAVRQLEMQEWTRNRADLQARVSIAREAVKRLASGVCPTCGAEAKTGLATAQEKVDELSKILQSAGVAPELAVADRRVAELTAELQATNQQGISLKEALQRNAELSAKLENIESQIAELNASIPSLEGSIIKAKEEIDLEEACVSALGIKGIRAHLLSGALSALETGANYWLGRFYPDNSVKLSITLVGETVSFGVTGLAKDVGYKGLSSGQKRRVNLAVVMSLGTLAGYAGGHAGGTIFFDEVLDTLDQEGYEVVTEVIKELAQENCIVVISHSRELVRRLRPDIIYRVENGQYTRVNSAEEFMPKSSGTTQG